MTPDPAPVVIRRPASAHGWQRYPFAAGAAPGKDVWEKPDGTLIALPKGTVPYIETFIRPPPQDA